MASGTLKLCTPYKQALNRLLWTISGEIEEKEFKKLTRLYDVKPDDQQALDQFDMLQYLHEQGVLDLESLVENLNTVGCQDQGKRVKEFISSKEHQDRGYPDGELVQPVLDTRDKRPIEEQDGQEETPFVYSPPAMGQMSINRHRKAIKLSVPGGASVKYLECDSTCNSENSEEEQDDDDKPPVATGMDLVYMTRALELSKQSGDPRTKVGAVFVSQDGEIIGEGFNHLPREDLDWENKDPYVIYAASAAMLNAHENQKSLKGSTLYTNLYPGSRDAGMILEAEVKEVVYLEIKQDWRKRYHTGATKKLFDGEVASRQLSMPE